MTETQRQEQSREAGESPFSTIEEAIEDIRAGRMVVVCDGEDRENEGDLVMAAQFATPEAVNFMAKEARGLVCLALTPQRCERLGLNLMAAKNEAPLETAFTVSIEAAGGVSTGISAHDRAHTIQVAIDPDSGPRDIVVPGHMFPLQAKEGGVLERTGHTEASVDLARLAGLTPGRGDLRGDERRRHHGPRPRPRPLLREARTEDDHRRRPDRLPAPQREAGRAGRRRPACRPPSATSPAVGYRSLVDDKHHVAMVKGEVDGAEDVLVRVHSECLTGDVFHSMRCDCGEQLEAALAMIEQRGPRRPPLPLPGGARDRPAEQAPRLQTAGGRGRHGRGQPQARPARRPARLRDRRPDPRRPRADQHPHPHQQPEKDRRPRGLRALGHRAGADRVGAQRPQRGLPADQARQDGPLAPPPGPGARRGDDPRRDRARRQRDADG